MFVMRSWAIAALLLASTACQGTTVPQRRDIVGSWETKSFTGATVRMTLSETARAVTGGGSWLTVEDDWALEVTGALAVDEVSLLFTFDERESIAFQGYFSEDDVMVGTLTGDGYRRAPITFERITLAESN